MKWPMIKLGKVAKINPKGNVPLGLDNEMPVSFVPMAAVSEHSASITQYLTRPLKEVRKGFTQFIGNRSRGDGNQC